MTMGTVLHMESPPPLKRTIMEINYVGYPVFKGLQKPLEFMGIRGRFLTFAYIKQRSGLHAKKRHRGIFVYKDLYIH